MNIKETFISYMEEAIGRENALVAFSAFDEPASTAVRYNPFKPCRKAEGKQVQWSEHGVVLQERPLFTLDPLFMQEPIMCRTHLPCLSDMLSGNCFRRLICHPTDL